MRFHLHDKADVRRIHEEQIEEHGGLSGIRDEGLLESALGRADNLIYYSTSGVTLYGVVASLAFGLARNHPFLDGKKRTSLVVAVTTLRENGYDLDVSFEELLATWLALAAGTLQETGLADWLRRHAVPIASTN